MMKFRVSKIVSFIMVIMLLFASVLSGNGKRVSAAAGIAGNGTQGITIDINAAPYTTMAQVPTWGKWAYTDQGCAWFATARAKQLTGKNITTIYSGTSWYNKAYSSFGFSRGKSIPADQKALACYNGHVSVVEKVVGDTVYISEGGNQNYGGNGYSCIRGVTKAYLTGANINGGFIGFVYLGVSQGTAQNNVAFQNQKVNFTKNTNAEVFVKIMNPARQRFSKVGCHLYNENGTLLKSYSENCTLATSHVNYTCNFNSDMKYSLAKGTTYKYVLYAVVGGKEYKDTMRSFKTTGSNAAAISFTGQKANFIHSNNAELYVKILNPSRKKFSKVGCYLYNSNGKLVKSYSENCSLSTSYINYACNVKTDMKIGLSSKTTYKYILYAVVDGIMYKDGMRQFTTK